MIIKIERRNFLTLVFSFIVIGLFLPLQSVLAFWGALANLTATAIATLFFGLFVVLSTLWLEFAEWLLRFVLSPDFINLSYTTNPFVEMGWTITRDFINMFFIIILVVMGLAVALRISEYQWPKTLPRLILIALLINFTPVILGLIIDASNIIMNFFISGITKETFFATRIGGYASFAFDLTQGANWMEYIIMPIAFISFNFIAGIMYLLFAMLFIFRYVALWTFVILSPIAFFCYILPATKPYFNMWWKHFIQWCLIGINAAFFIYLADQLLFYVITDPGFISEGEKEGWGLINVLIPYYVVIAFLYIGFFLSLASAPMGTNAVFSVAQKGIQAPGKWIGKTAQRRIAGPAAGATAKGLSGITKKTEKVPILKWATRGLQAGVSPLTEYAAKQRRISKPAGWDQMSVPEKEMYVDGLSMAQDQLVLASTMKGEGTFQKSGSDFQGKIRQTAARFAKDSRYLGEISDIFDASPDKLTYKIKLDMELAPLPESEKAKVTKKFNEQIGETRDELFKEEIKEKSKKEGLSEDDIIKKYKYDDKATQVLHIRGFKPKDVSGMAKGSLKSEPFKLAMQKMSSSHLQALRNSFDEETVNEILEGDNGLNNPNTITQEKLNELNKKNPGLVRWAFQNPAGKEMLNWDGREDLKNPSKISKPSPSATETIKMGFAKIQEEKKDKKSHLDTKKM